MRLIIPALLSFILSNYSYSEPLITVIGGDTINFGRVHQGFLARPMIIRNNGSDTLHISKIKPNYTGLYAPISRIDIAPGDTALVRLGLNVLHVHGRQSYSFSILSNSSP